ncbi:MAG: hypothetical protein KC476_09560 [Cyanobacteria bacterium HKST-UBA06]|nr:hypothetical protein [Cyanobacteria bacterium HKST-UBA04]MCA9808187.1 hypothetical protein [Cyanobacteria bacterium HKST-UBA06]MCA9840657.1 hypothetical protein [Cyanobacteria bacterium HKST-UBA03]
MSVPFYPQSYSSPMYSAGVLGSGSAQMGYDPNLTGGFGHSFQLVNSPNGANAWSVASSPLPYLSHQTGGYYSVQNLPLGYQNVAPQAPLQASFIQPQSFAYPQPQPQPQPQQQWPGSINSRVAPTYNTTTRVAPYVYSNATADDASVNGNGNNTVYILVGDEAIRQVRGGLFLGEPVAYPVAGGPVGSYGGFGSFAGPTVVPASQPVLSAPIGSPAGPGFGAVPYQLQGFY